MFLRGRLRSPRFLAAARSFADDARAKARPVNRHWEHCAQDIGVVSVPVGIAIGVGYGASIGVQHCRAPDKLDRLVFGIFGGSAGGVLGGAVAVFGGVARSSVRATAALLGLAAVAAVTYAIGEHHADAQRAQVVEESAVHWQRRDRSTQ